MPRPRLILLGIVLILGPTEVLAQDCTTDHSKCAYLATASKVRLEPSGVVWSEKLGVAVGVHDERDGHVGYEIFAFDPTKNGEIRVTALLSKSQSDGLKMDDLEGITLLPNGKFVAISSLSLDKDEVNAEDRWTRHRGFIFEVAESGDSLAVSSIEVVSEQMRPDMREWFISSSGAQWPEGSHTKRAEHHGINVEGIASTSSGKLIVGFRGPLFSNFRVPLAELPVAAAGDIPGPPTWRFIDVSSVPSDGASLARGIRAIERVPDSDSQYVVVLGHEGGFHDRLRVGIWDSGTGMYQDRFQLPSRFVAEGVAVSSSGRNELDLILVSDLDGLVMNLKISR